MDKWKKQRRKDLKKIKLSTWFWYYKEYFKRQSLRNFSWEGVRISLHIRGYKLTHFSYRHKNPMPIEDWHSFKLDTMLWIQDLLDQGKILEGWHTTLYGAYIEDVNSRLQRMDNKEQNI